MSIFRNVLTLSVAAVLALSGFGCKIADRETQAKMQPVTLSWWSVFTDYAAVAPLIASYRTVHPNIRVDFRRLGFDEYEDVLLNALAEGRGPDIFSLHNTWIRGWQDRLLPSPPTLTMAFQEVKGSVKKETIVSLRQVAGATPASVANDFLNVVATDVILDVPQDDPRLPPVQRVYALPLALDTLVMYYNRALLNQAGIAMPAQSWTEFQRQARLLTVLDEDGKLVRSAAALGTADNVERAADILALLMMQNGTPMSDRSGQVVFDRQPADAAGQEMAPGAVALVFYNDFANPVKEVYSWNADRLGSFRAFVAGQAAYFFGYSYHLPMIRAQAPTLDFRIAPVPQIEGNQPVNFANYWTESVSRATKYPDEAWDFLKYVTDAERAKPYLAAAARPTALRQLVNGQLEDADMSVFAAQLPSARSWYRGLDGQAAERVLEEMISAMLLPDADPQRILELGAVRLNQTVR